MSGNAGAVQPGRPNAPAPLDCVSPDITSPKASHLSSPSPRTPKSSPSPFHDVIPVFWPREQLMWLDLIYKSNERMRQFISVANSRGTKVSQLPCSLELQPNCDRWCLRIVTPIAKMDEPLEVLFETYPDLFGYLFPRIDKQLSLERKALS